MCSLFFYVIYLRAVSVRVEREALDELPDEGRLVQCARVHELAARVDVRHRQLLDLHSRGWLGVRRGAGRGARCALATSTGRGATLARVHSRRPTLWSTS